MYNKMSERLTYLPELIIFDIAYIISNCDYAYSSDERKYLKIILEKYDDDDKELLMLRTQFLDGVLSKGIDEVKKFIRSISRSLKNKIDDDLKDAYLELFREVIMLDKEIHENELLLYKILCDEWERESGI